MKKKRGFMSKRVGVYIIIICIVCLSLFVTAYIGADFGVYSPSEDFTKISVSFFGAASTVRAFSFYTADASYEGVCSIQLDPADDSENAPSFTDKDNILIPAVSHYTKLVFPVQLRHMALAQDLLPGTKYFYRVGWAQRNKWSPWGYFITDDNDNNLSFLHITDSQAKTAEDFDAYNNALRKAYDTLGIPEFILSTGDQVEMGVSAPMWDDYFAVTQQMLLQTTMAPVSGNHEFVPQAVLNHFYLDAPELVNYSFEYGNALFIILDTNDFSMTSQLAWAEQVLQASSKKWKIVAFHKAPYSSGTHADDIDVTKLRQLCTPLFADCGVDLVLNGHDHVYCRTYPIGANGQIAIFSNRTESLSGTTKYYYDDPQGVIYVINRSIGTKFYGKSNSLNDDLIEKGDTQRVGKPVFSNVSITANSLSYTAYQYDREGNGEVRIYDAFVIQKSS
jgi:3',5'-cyclic AMP phosphodiesterase CpdA